MRFLLSLAFAFILFSDAFAADPFDRPSLLAAWERIVRADPDTLRFEKLDEKRYAFATKRFPFDGTLEVLNLSLNEFDADLDTAVRSGVVEFDLVGVDAEFRRKYALSLGAFQSHVSTLFHSAEQGGWRSMAEFRKHTLENVPPIRPGFTWYNFLSAHFLLIVFLLCLLFLTFALRKAGGQYKKAQAAQDLILARQAENMRQIDRSLELAVEQNRLLGDILAEIKRAAPARPEE